MEANSLSFDNSCKFGGDKTSFMAKKYTSGMSVYDGGLLSFIHSHNIRIKCNKSQVFFLFFYMYYWYMYPLG